MPMKKILLLGIILLFSFFCFIFLTFQPQSAVILVDSSKPKKRLILIDPNCLERLLRNLECELPIRIGTEIENEQLEAYKDRIKLEFHLNGSRGKDFWLFRPVSNSSSSNGQIATKRFSTVPFSSFSTQFGQNLIPLLEVPIPIHSFIKSWKRGKFFECGDEKGHPLIERKNGQKQIIPLNITKRLAQFMDLLETHNATGVLMGGTLLGWRRECSIIPHTHDIDLGILREEHSESLVRALINSFDGAYLLGHLSESLIIKFDVDRVLIDLFYIYPHPENKTSKSYVAGFRNDKRQLLFWVYPRILEFCTGEILGHLFHLPCNFDDFIISDYGSSEWKIDFPSSNFIWDQSHKNIESREIRTPQEWAKTSMQIDKRWKYDATIVNKGLKQMGII